MDHLANPDATARRVLAASARQELLILAEMFPTVPANTLNILMERCEGNVDLVVDLIRDIRLPLESEMERDNQSRTPITSGLLAEGNDRATDKDFQQASTSRMISGKRLPMDRATGDANRNKTPRLATRNANLYSPSASTSHSQHTAPSPGEHLAADRVNDEEDTIPLTLDAESLECLLALFGEIAFPVPDGVFPTVDLPLSLARQIGGVVDVMEIDDEETVDLKLDPEFCRQLQNRTGTRPSFQTGCNADSPVAVDLPVSLARQIYVYLIESQQQEVKRNAMRKESKRNEARYERIMKDAKFAHRLSEADPSISTPQVMQSAPARGLSSRQMLEGSEKMRQLISMFPNVDKGLLLDVLEANRNSLDCTVEIQTLPLNRSEEIVPTREELLELKKKRLEDAKKAILTSVEPSPDTVRGQAMADAQHHREEAQLHGERAKKANELAVGAILTANAAGQRSDTLNLRFLKVTEAKVALQLFLDQHATQLVHSGRDSVTLFLIVGRGTHSVGGLARVRPAVQDWLRRVRGLDYDEVDPAMLRVVVKRNGGGGR